MWEWCREWRIEGDIAGSAPGTSTEWVGAEVPRDDTRRRGTVEYDVVLSAPGGRLPTRPGAVACRPVSRAPSRLAGSFTNDARYGARDRSSRILERMLGRQHNQSHDTLKHGLLKVSAVRQTGLSNAEPRVHFYFRMGNTGIVKIMWWWDSFIVLWQYLLIPLPQGCSEHRKADCGTAERCPERH